MDLIEETRAKTGYTNREPRKKGRPVTVTYRVWKDDTPTDVASEATFHCWGLKPTKQVGPDNAKIVFSETAGICELPDGRIRFIKPEYIKFTDRRTV